jgi:hypothetical protein
MITYNFTPDKNGGEAFIFTQDEDVQVLCLESYGSSAEFTLELDTITPAKLRELADLLDNN